MSVHEELITLKETREVLKNQLVDISLALKKLHDKRAPLVQKVEELSTRTSSLAQTILEKVKEELEKLEQEILPVERRKEEIEKEIEENQRNISMREDEPDLYINEQSSAIVSYFLEYLRNHLEEFGKEIKKTFCVTEVTRYKDDRYGGCHVPTGKIGIYDENKKMFIVFSKDFYFIKELYEVERCEYNDRLVCYRTKWYNAYHDRFISKLLETLEKEYTYGEFFKLTIEDSHFTLELV